MEKISKKEIKTIVTTALQQALKQLEIASPSRKTSKLVDVTSRKLTTQLKRDVKKKVKMARKATVRVKKSKDTMPSVSLSA